MTDRPLEEDEVEYLIRTTRARYVLEILQERSTAIDIHSLAQAIDSKERELGKDSPDDRCGIDVSYWEVRSSLENDHLPALDEAGLITYDPEKGLVDLGNRTPFAVVTNDVESWDLFWNTVDTAVMPILRNHGVDDVERREITDALLRLGAERPEELARLVLEARRNEKMQSGGA